MTNKPPEDVYSSSYKAWADAQKAWMDSWMRMMGAGTAPTKPPQPAGAEQSPADSYSYWSDMWMQNIQEMSAGASPIVKATMEQFVASQEYSMRYMDFMTRAWNSMAVQAKTGDEMREALDDSRQKTIQEWESWPAISTSMAQDMNQLWGLYMQQWQQFGIPWMSAYQSAPEYQARLISGDHLAMFGLTDLYRDAYQQTMGRLVASPNLGPAREINELMQKGFDAWVDWYLANQDYQSILSETWQKAINNFYDRLMEMSEKGEEVGSVRELMLLWTRGAEKIFTETFREERYTLVQGKMLNAAMVYRKQQRLIMEEYLNTYDLLTRSELDETHRRIHDLRKEVKMLKKELSKMKDINEYQVREIEVESKAVEVAEEIEAKETDGDGSAAQEGEMS